MKRRPPETTLAWAVYEPATGRPLSIMGEVVVLTSRDQARMYTKDGASVRRVCIAPVPTRGKK